MASPVSKISAEPIDFAGRLDLWELHESEWKTAPAIKPPNVKPERNDSCPCSFLQLRQQVQGQISRNFHELGDVPYSGTKFFDKFQSIDLIYQIFNQGCRCFLL